jgi:hypothetical protein
MFMGISAARQAALAGVAIAPKGHKGDAERLLTEPAQIAKGRTAFNDG